MNGIAVIYNLFAASVNEKKDAEVAELADAQDLKSCDHCDRTGSIPVLGTKN